MQDVVQLLGLLPFSEMTGSTTAIQIQEVMCVGLGVSANQLQRFFVPLHNDLKGITTEKLGIDLQKFFGLLHSARYMHSIRTLYVDRSLFSNLDLIKTGVYLHAVHKMK